MDVVESVWSFFTIFLLPALAGVFTYVNWQSVPVWFEKVFFITEWSQVNQRRLFALSAFAVLQALRLLNIESNEEWMFSGWELLAGATVFIAVWRWLLSTYENYPTPQRREP